MTSIPILQASAKFDQLVEEVVATNKPIRIVGKHRNAFLVSEATWRGIQETPSLLAIRGLRESIQAGMRQPLRKAAKNLIW